MATATKNTEEKKLTTTEIATRHRTGRSFLALKEQVKGVIEEDDRIQDWMDRGFIDSLTWHSVTSPLFRDGQPTKSGSFTLSVDEIEIEAKMSFITQRLKVNVTNLETGDKIPVQMVMAAESGDDLEQLKAVVQIIKDEWSALI